MENDNGWPDCSPEAVERLTKRLRATSGILAQEKPHDKG